MVASALPLAALDQLEHGVVLRDADSNVVYLNPAACRILGVTTAAELTLEAVSEWNVLDEHGERLTPAQFREANEAGKGTEGLLQVQRAGQPTLWLDSRTKRFEFPDGTIGSMAVFSDITRIHEARLTAEAQTKYFRLLAENATDIVVMSSLDQVMEWVSPSFTTLLGWQPDQLIGRTGDFIIHPTQHQERDARVEEMRSGAEAGMEACVLNADGEYRWFEIKARPVLDDDGQPIGLLASGRDIHEAVLAREALAASEARLKRRNEDLAQFAYVASHDLQAPLRTVGGFVEVLMAQLDPALVTADQRQMAAAITSGVGDMQRLIRGLLAYSRIDASAAPAEAFTVTSAVNRVVRGLSHDIDAAEADVVCYSDDSVTGDPVQFRQILQNLIGNALTHRDPDRPLMVQVSSRDCRNGMIEIRVGDNGPGIPADYHDRVFEIFQQVNKSSGTGIGLAIVKRIVERHGGRCTLESDGRSGTSVRFTFPAAGL